MHETDDLTIAANAVRSVGRCPVRSTNDTLEPDVCTRAGGRIVLLEASGLVVDILEGIFR